MTDRSDVPPKNNSNDSEIESPVDGPQPDWMRAATSSSQSSFDENKAPDWLKSIRSGKGESPPETAALPSDSDAHELADDGGMSDLERLLAEEGIDLNTVSELRPEGSEGMSAKDWLISTSDDDLVRKRLDDTPMEASPPPSTPPAVSADGMSDIERLLAEEGIDINTVTEDRPEGSEGMSAKDWLISTSDDDLVRKRLDTEPIPDIAVPPSPQPAPSVMSSGFEDDDKMVVADDLPDWLRETPAEETEAVETVLSIPESLPEDDDDKMVVADDLPDWLQEIPDDEPVSVEREIAPSEPAAIAVEDNDNDKMVVSDGLPDWLQEIPDDEPGVETLPSSSKPVAVDQDGDDKMVVSDDLPDWLQEVEEDEIETPTASAAEEVGESEDLPDWLRDVEKESLEDTFKVSAAVAATSDEIGVETDDLPDWLRQTQRDETGEVTLPADDVKDEDVPDWLKRVQAEQDQATSLAAAEPSAAMASPETGDAAEGLPAWLKESEAEEEPLAVASIGQDAPAEEDDDLPDWLQEVELAEDDLFEPSEPSPDPFADVLVVEEEEIDEDELPGWLQEVQKETEEEIAEAPLVAFQAEPEPVAATTTERQDDFIDQEGLPDWLQEENGAPSELEPVEPGEPAQIVAAKPAPATKPKEKEPTAEEPEPALRQEEIRPVSGQTDTTLAGGMPNWLKKLREGGETEEAPKAQPAPIPATPPTPAIPTPPPSPMPVAPAKPAPPPPAAPVAVMPETAPASPPTYEDLPADIEERLKLAQIAGEDGNLDEVARIYGSVVAGGTHLDVVIERIQQMVKLYPDNPALYQVMGDAMMRDDRLKSALEAYRAAMAYL